MVDMLGRDLFTLRDMYDQFENIVKMGPLGKMMEMMPGMGNLAKEAQKSGIDSSQKIKNYMIIMDSMTDPELDDPDVLFKSQRESRVRRIARGSGRSVPEVNELLEQYRNFEKMMKGMKGMKMGKNGQINGRNLQQLSSMLPPQAMAQMGGSGGLQNLLKSFTGK